MTGRAGSGDEDRTARIDMGEFDAAVRAIVPRLLDGSSIPYRVDGRYLEVPPGALEEVRDLIDTVAGDQSGSDDAIVETVPGPFGGQPWSNAVQALQPMARSDGTVPLLASVSRRVLAQCISYFAWSMVLVGIGLVVQVFYGGLPDWWALVIFFLPILAEIPLIARTGEDPGKYLLGIRVQRMSGEMPGWLPAFLRSLTVQAPALLSWLPGPIGAVFYWAYLPWLVAIVISIVRDDESRGWHDHVAGTIVLVRARVTP